MADLPKNLHHLTVQEALSLLATDRERGLTSDEAGRRLKMYGPNQLEPVPKPSPIKIFFKQFANLLIGLLIAALLVSGFLGEVVDSIVIGVIVFFVAFVGFVQEYRAEKTLESLKKMLTPTTDVVRDGVRKEIPVKEVVPGDIVVLSQGAKVPADMRLIEAVNLQIDEAPLTGESVPVAKSVEPLPENIPLGDRVNMAYAGTTVTYGRGKGVVYATGSRTEFGQIAKAATSIREEKTPLEARMSEIGKKFAILAVVIIAAVFTVELATELASGALSLSFLVEVLLFSVALAVAVVPEALPGIVTATLAIGMGIMARRNALVRRMPAVETLGSTQVICFDKTGTITLNQMTVRQLYLSGEFLDVNAVSPARSDARHLLRAAVLCNESTIVIEGGRRVVRGDPTEGALVMLAEDLKLNVENERKSFPRIHEIPFTSERKAMTTVHRTNEGRIVSFMKGAAEVVLSKCSHIFENGVVRPLTDNDVKKILGKAEDMAGRSLRVLALAFREMAEQDLNDLERDFVFVGLVGLMDQPRPDAVQAVKTAHTAGIKTVMVTGDHKLTALAIAKEVGIYKEGDLVLTGEELDQISDDELDKIVERVVVYARISPMHKLRIVEAWKRRGYVVAMTGDGVNDAPALKKADIGVAMGITGTDVAKESSDMVLADDNFATIVKAVELGRWIYGNVRKYLAYLLNANLTEIVVISAVALVISRIFGFQGEETLPLLPVHILYINLATDGLPALALGFSPPDPDIMRKKPIPKDEPVFNKEVLNFLFTVMVVSSPILLLGYITGLQHGLEHARSRLFLMFITKELMLALGCRSLKHSVLRVRPHKWLLLAVVWEIVLISTIMMVPGGREVLRLTVPTWDDLLWIIGGAVVLFASVELVKQTLCRPERALSTFT